VNRAARALRSNARRRNAALDQPRTRILRSLTGFVHADNQAMIHADLECDMHAKFARLRAFHAKALSDNRGNIANARANICQPKLAKTDAVTRHASRIRGDRRWHGQC